MHPAVGVNYDWWKITPGTNRAHCKRNAEPRDDYWWFLPSYDKPGIRAAVVGQLRAMRAAGFTSLRVMVFHDHSTDPWEADSFTSLDGSIRPQDRAKLARFVGDVAAAGFHTLEVVPSFQRRNDLYCQDRTIGDCFDARRTGENWRFISQTAHIVRAWAGGMALRFDLGNEDAPDPAMPAPVRVRAARYIQTIARRFQKRYGSAWTFSVARSDRGTFVETRNRLNLLLADLAQLHLHPRFLEIHTYDTDPGNLRATLGVTQQIADRVGARIVLGELAYHNAVQASVIARWLKEHPDSRIDDVMQWPEYDPSLACAPLPHPPYTPGPLGAIAPSPAPVARVSPAPQWLVASDIHLDPFDWSPDPADYGSDANLALFASALAAMKRSVPDPAVVLLPGDFLAHAFASLARHNGADPTAAAVTAMRMMAGAFARTFPHARFAIALGNNDAPCGDYRSDAGDPYLRRLARIWRLPPTFAGDGYYALRLPEEHLRLVVLNTVLLSAKYRGSCGGEAAHAAARELAWLRATLRATPPGQRNVVMMHVPPGFDAFSTQAARGLVPWPFLRPRGNRELIDLLESPADRVAYAIAGHTHRFDFRLAGNVPILVFGSISPVYHNNPAFYGLQIAGNGSLLDVDVYAYDDWSQRWLQPRSIGALWHFARVDAASLLRIHRELGAARALRRRWDEQSGAWPSNPGVLWTQWTGAWRVPWCAQTQLGAGFAACARIRRRAELFALLAPALVALALAASAYALVRGLVRRRPAGPGGGARSRNP
jgi:hypothetical protein